MEREVDAVRRPSETARFSASAGLRLTERHPGIVDQGHGSFAYIEDAYAHALVGKSDREW